MIHSCHKKRFGTDPPQLQPTKKNGVHFLQQNRRNWTPLSVTRTGPSLDAMHYAINRAIAMPGQHLSCKVLIIRIYMEHS
jgi:hypothetical protein